MYLVQGIHPHFPGVPMKLFNLEFNAHGKAFELVKLIGNDVMGGLSQSGLINDDDAEAYSSTLRGGDWKEALNFLKDKSTNTDYEDEFDIWLMKIEAEDEPRIPIMEPGAQIEIGTLRPDLEYSGLATRRVVSYGDFTIYRPDGTEVKIEADTVDVPPERGKLVAVDGKLVIRPLDAVEAGSNGPSVADYDRDQLAAYIREHVIDPMKTAYDEKGATAFMSRDFARSMGFPEYVHPLDPADHVVTTLVHKLANIIATPPAGWAEIDDLSLMVHEMLGIAQEAMEAGQAWLDKARPVGRIADDVVRLAGIIVAGTDLHACLSEAMDQHIYDESNGEAPDEDCGYTAALKGWTDALAGIVVTTPAPAAPVQTKLEAAAEMFLAAVAKDGLPAGWGQIEQRMKEALND